MFRRIAIVTALVGGGLAAAPTAASADPLCEAVFYQGVIAAYVTPPCIPYDGAPDCTSGYVLLGDLGTVYDQVCVPRL